MTEELLEFLFNLILYGVAPLSAVGLYLTRNRSSAFSLYFYGGVLILFLWFAFLKGQYHLLGSTALRYLMPVFGLAVVTLGIRRARGLPFTLPLTKRGVGLAAISGAVALGLVYYNIEIIRGFSLEKSPVEMAFPFREGRFLITGGGSNAAHNYHYQTSFLQQRYAVDISKLSGVGVTRTRVLGNTNEDFHIFGEEVLAPCLGVILKVRDGIQDNEVGSYSAKGGSGNHVVIQCSHATVYLYHLQNNSVAVADGQNVSPGQVVGRVGNSGFSTSPHLHLHATIPGKNGTDENFELPVPILFDGKYLTSNDIVERRGG